MKQAASSEGREPQDDVAIAVGQVNDCIASVRCPLHSQVRTERELAVTLGLLRGKVREALQVLEDDGRVWRRVELGTFVGGHPHLIGSPGEPPAAVTSPTDIPEARITGEPIVARLSAQRAAQAEIVMIEHHAAKADKSRDWAEWEK